MSEKVHAIMKELRRQLEALYGPRLIRMVLYGSQSCGDAEPGSDIDVLVVLGGAGLRERSSPEPVTSFPRSLSRTVWCSLARSCHQTGSNVNGAPGL